jgi:hypothetical protein
MFANFIQMNKQAQTKEPKYQASLCRKRRTTRTHGTRHLAQKIRVNHRAITTTTKTKTTTGTRRIPAISVTYLFKLIA